MFFAFVALVAPVFFFPRFNKFTKLENLRIKVPILGLARANGIPATEVYEFDASCESNRVGGFAGTTHLAQRQSAKAVHAAGNRSDMGLNH